MIDYFTSLIWREQDLMSILPRVLLFTGLLRKLILMNRFYNFISPAPRSQDQVEEVVLMFQELQSCPSPMLDLLYLAQLYSHWQNCKYTRAEMK